MSEANRLPTRQFVEIGNSHVLAESASDFDDDLQSQLLERKLSSGEVDKRINPIVAPLATQLETLIQSLRELSEKSSNRSTEGNVASERSRSSGQRSDNYPTIFLMDLWKQQNTFFLGLMSRNITPTHMISDFTSS